MECSHQILSGLQVNPHLAADGTVHLGEQRGGNLNEGDASQIGRGHKACQIAHNSTTEGHDETLPLNPMRGQLVVALLDGGEILDRFAGLHRDQGRSETRDLERFDGRLSVVFTDVGIGDHRAPRPNLETTATLTQRRNEAGTDLNLIGTVPQRNLNSWHGR